MEKTDEILDKITKQMKKFNDALNSMRENQSETPKSKAVDSSHGKILS